MMMKSKSLDGDHDEEMSAEKKGLENETGREIDLQDKLEVFMEFSDC